MLQYSWVICRHKELLVAESQSPLFTLLLLCAQNPHTDYSYFTVFYD